MQAFTKKDAELAAVSRIVTHNRYVWPWVCTFPFSQTFIKFISPVKGSLYGA